jgi:proline dehydrogenase
VLAIEPLRVFAFDHARRYVAGCDEGAAFATVHALELEGLSASVDLFGESVDDTADADHETNRYVVLASMVAAHPGTYLSLDCSHLGLDQDPIACGDRVEQIASALPTGSRLQLGAEESTRTDPILEIARVASGAGLPIMVTVQANLRRSPRDIEQLAELQIPIRLVKGAYAEAAHIAHRWGAETDAAYIALASRLANLGADHSLATHDPVTLAQLLSTRDHAMVEFLLGIRADQARRLVQRGHHVRIYVPYGDRWLRYYARRIAESIGA